MKPLVSVIIPVYNVYPYLREALNSVINQTYQNLEILIIDDGSTDGSDRICDEYAEKDQRVKVVHQKNKGLSSARNVGLDWMTGEMVAMLDSDDAYDITFIEELKSAMEREQADLALSKYTIHSTSGKMNRGKKDVLKPWIQAGTYDRAELLRALSDGSLNVSVFNKLYRRELWKEIRFLDGHVCEDREATYRIISKCGKAVVVDSPLYFYRKRPGSITTAGSWKYLRDQILVTSRVDKFIIENFSDELSEEDILKIRQTRLNSMITAYARLFTIPEQFPKNTEGEKLRQQIIHTSEEIGTENCKIRIRAASHMIRFCPWLFRVSYHVYLPIRLFVYKLTGK